MTRKEKRGDAEKEIKEWKKMTYFKSREMRPVETMLSVCSGKSFKTNLNEKRLYSEKWHVWKSVIAAYQ